MTFAIRNLSVLAYAQGFTLWHYRAHHAASDQPGFFAPAADLLSPGDIVLISSPNAGRAVFVTATSGGVQTAPLG